MYFQTTNKILIYYICHETYIIYVLSSNKYIGEKIYKNYILKFFSNYNISIYIFIESIIILLAKYNAKFVHINLNL